MLKDEFLPGDMGATKAKEEEVETPLEIRLDDDFGGDSSCILVWMVSIPKLWDACFRVHGMVVLFIISRLLLHWGHGKGTNKTMTC